MDEFTKKKVVRKGKLKQKIICPMQQKAVGGRCIKMAPVEKIKRGRSAKKASRKRAAKMAKIVKKRSKSMKKRTRMGI